MTGRAAGQLEEFLAALPEERRGLFREIAQCAVSLGYTPKRTRSKDVALDFFKSSVRRTILKMELHSNAKAGNGPGLRLKFYASPDYSDIFRQGVRRVIEEFGGKYTGCYGCGRCGGRSEGYTYRYPDGREVFRCGNELIEIPHFGDEHLPEIKALLKAQDDFFLQRCFS